MKLKSFRLAEALIGLFLSLFAAYSYFQCNTIFKDPAVFRGFSVFSWLESLELKLYDARSKFRTSIDAGENEIAIVAIDDDSLSKLGRWPWPRNRHAQLIDKLAAAKPKILGVEILYSEPQEVQGADEIKGLKAAFDDLVQSRKIRPNPRAQFDPQQFSAQFDAALDRLNMDAKLKDSLSKAGNVVLPMVFEGGGLRGAKPEPMPSPIATADALKVHMLGYDSSFGPSTDGMKPLVPLPDFAAAAQGVGYLNVYSDFDGTVRREYPVMKYDEAFYPSFALSLVTRYLGFEPKDVIVTPGRSIAIGNNVIPLDASGSMLISFNGPTQTFHTYSAFDVLSDKVAMDVFKDKIVILGPSAAAISTLYVAPVTHNLPATELLANVVENILHMRFLTRPVWAYKAEYGAIAVAGLFLMFVLPYLGAVGGAVLMIILLAALGGVGTFFFVNKGLWLKIGYPAFSLVAGYVLITTKRLFVTEKGKEKAEASQIETNKMLGLSFQGQGQLDLAFEKFRACPMDESMRDLLYNLGLDFERKRQYNKAAVVYEQIATKYPNYKDITEKTKMLKQAAQGAVFGGIGGKGKEGTALIASGASKPTLGRYEVEKEIGRGAMGIVYLGNDPKINRKVAIKTMVLEEGMEAAAVKETRERFFREAESAGTLNHPNIVRIFDAGEENDVAYIAMEFLEGHDLVRYTSKSGMLAPDLAMEYVARVADALDYANAQGIVHRDIKPANIMLLKDGSIRVTDFGIARITASSKTATGTVVGTPAYMSPEQVGGKKVDGRSDIFSLGIVLFELLLGEKPFKGGEGGLGTLLFQIANDPEPEPLTLNPQLHPMAVDIIHKALRKDPLQRYQRGGEIATALRLCIKLLKEGVSAPAAVLSASAAPSLVPVPVQAASPPPVVPLPSIGAMPPAGEVERTIPAGGIPPLAVSAPAASTPTPAAAAGELERTIPAGMIPPISAPAPSTSAPTAAADELERTMPAGAIPALSPATQPSWGSPPASAASATASAASPAKASPEVPIKEKTLSPEEIAAAITMPEGRLPRAEETTMPEPASPSASSPAAGQSTMDLTLPMGAAAPAQEPSNFPLPADVTLPEGQVQAQPDPTLPAMAPPMDATLPSSPASDLTLPQAPAATPPPALDFDATIPAGGAAPQIQLTLPDAGNAEAEKTMDAFSADTTLKLKKPE